MKSWTILMLLPLAGFALITPGKAEGGLAPKRAKLRNGVVLLTSEQQSLPMVTLTLLMEAGSRFEPAGKEGLAHLAARLLTYGTRRRNAQEISEILDFIGAEISTTSSEDLATISLTILKKDLDTGLDLLAELLTEAVFPIEEIERQKQSTIAQIQANEERPSWIAQKKLFETLFPGSPYGRPVEGDPESLQKIEQKDLISFYQRFYRPDHAILAAVGDISHQEIAKKLEQVFQAWKPGGAAITPPSLPPAGTGRQIKISKDLTQANILMGQRGVTRSHRDYYAIQVMNYILGGGGFSSRLMDSVRNERGLAYSVYSVFDAEKYAGTFQIVMQTKNETADEAVRVAREEVRRIREAKVTPEELQDAKDFLIGSFPLRFDTNRRVADFLAYAEFFELGPDYIDRYPELIRRVNLDEIFRVAGTYLQPDQMVLVMVAKESKKNPAK